MNASETTNSMSAPATTGKWPTLSLPTDVEGRKRFVLAGFGLAIVFYAYFINQTCLLGITGSPSVSLAKWLLVSWGRGEDFAHGYIVPFIFVGLFAWKWKTKLHAVPAISSNAGLAVVLVALLMYWAGVRATNPRVTAMSSVTLVYGLVLYLGGWAWAKELWFPCAFLLFMIPLDFMDGLAFKLRMVMTNLSTMTLNVLGMDVIQDGTGIKSRTGRFEPLDVANPCSGIRSLVALTALAAVYGYVTMDRGWKKWLMFFSSVPLAVLGNWARIVTIVLVAQGFGQDVAMKVYHDYSGYIVFSLAILCMIGLGTAVNVNYSELVHRLTKEEVELPKPMPRRQSRR